MPDRLTTIYTRKGDSGHTSLRDQPIAKDDLLVEALGSVDELNSAIGLIIATGIHDKTVEASLTRIQHDLFDLGGELHLPTKKAITAEKVTRLEQELDQWNNHLPPLKEFLLPRGNLASATCHLARTICRRTERAFVRLNHQVALDNPEMLRYLNRLSDLLFVIARVLAKETNADEVLWEHK